MSKLFKLQQWLTTEKAAKHLSSVLAEPVSEADVLKLGLDGHLTISVNFVNSTPAIKGNVIPLHEASYFNVPGKDKAFFEGMLPDKLLCGIMLGSQEVIELESDFIRNITGTWDLPLIGNDRAHVEYYYNNLAFGVELDSFCLDGTFVTASDNVVYQIQECFGDYKGLGGARDRQQEKLRKLQFSKSTNKRKAKLIELRQEKFKKLGEQWNKWRRIDRYYPAGQLPDDSVLVVRTSAITDFLNTLDIETESEQLSNVKPEIKRKKDLSIDAIINFIQYIAANYPKATSKDIVSHCFECYAGNSRKQTEIKKIIAELGIELSGSGKRTSEAIEYMQTAPKYKPTHWARKEGKL